MLQNIKKTDNTNNCIPTSSLYIRSKKPIENNFIADLR